MFSTLLAKNFCTVLQYEYVNNLSLCGGAHHAIQLMTFYINTWQDMHPKPIGMTNENGRLFACKDEHFADLLEVIAIYF